MNMLPVRSSAISAVGYDADTQRMQIKFKQGHSYSFCRVPQHIYDGLMMASSKGIYYSTHIRGRYQC